MGSVVFLPYEIAKFPVLPCFDKKCPRNDG